LLIEKFLTESYLFKFRVGKASSKHVRRNVPGQHACPGGDVASNKKIKIIKFIEFNMNNDVVASSNKLEFHLEREGQKGSIKKM